MKTKLLMLAFFGIVSANAQTTHNLDWEIGANGPEMDITIDIGDTVIWTWTDAVPHTVQNVVGSSVETFNSGTLTGVGQTYSKTFTVEGENDYFCGIHGAASMSGTITVGENLSVDENKLKLFSITSNPAMTHLIIDLPPSVNSGELVIHDLLGKKVVSQTIQSGRQLSIDISSLKQGLYLVSLTSEDKKQTQRFIKN